MNIMSEEIMSFDLNTDQSSIIKVVGVGGGGSNAVNHMFREGIKDVDFIICNTDAQALEKSPVKNKIQLGESLTGGRGAGNNPEIGKQAAIENLNEVMEALSNDTHMVFITAGMGGGTGTGGAPVIAKAVKEAGMLTVAIVSIPFRFEGKQRHDQAIEGLDELSKSVDSMLVINNEKLREVHGNLKISQAFSQADNVIASAAKGIAEIVTLPGYINVDFADVQTVMKDSGVAIMGSAKAEGEKRAIDAIKDASTSPLLNNNDIQGAENILLNITSGDTDEISMDEVTEITDFVSEAVGNKEASIIWGTGIDSSLGNRISVTIIATGFEANIIPELYSRKTKTHKYTLQEQKQNAPVKHKAQNEKPHQSKEYVKNEETTEDMFFEVVQKSLDFECKNEPENSTIGIESGISFMEENNEEENVKIKNPDNTQQQKLKDGRPVIVDAKNIEDLENEPAYVRRKIKLNQDKISTKRNVSKYSLSDDETEQKATLKSDNSYLHDNVD
jgi:cell division protein FtsZ